MENFSPGQETPNGEGTVRLKGPVLTFRVPPKDSHVAYKPSHIERGVQEIRKHFFCY